MEMATMLQAIESWPVDQQIDFVEQVWDRIVDRGWQPAVTEEMKAELDRRLAAHEANPENVLSWEQIVAHVRRPR